ncbi:MAG: DNA gyrase subunit B [Candidatus Heimdallarchaeota archaeon]|nr:DNA gyrase subunit B [Candidatus Heimdallarchaeota archaeon]MDH5644435.1 DNA gyrase subunit B [Candidatus Heimdallarchaeota archaeon]
MDTYDESNIKVLEGTEGVRLRPAMYIGDVGTRGLHHLIFEVIDNSIDEAMAGRCSKVDIVLHKDGSVSLKDDGAGIPAGVHPEYGVPTLEVILTKLHSGGKFEKKAYQVSGGLHGIGLAAVCALSEEFHVESYRDKRIFSQNYIKGQKATDVEIKPLGDLPTGTLIRFKPDRSIFTVHEFDFELLAGRFRELAYLTSKFRINFSDERDLNSDGNIRTVSYYFEGGIKQFVEDSIGARNLLLPEQPTFYVWGEGEGVMVEAAFAYTDTYQETLRGFVNNINTHEGGTHISGFKTVLTRAMNDFARSFKLLKEKETGLSGNDVREGIVAIISVKVPHPQFEGQTKTKLGNSEVDGIVQATLGKLLKHWLEENNKLGKAIINKAVLARRAREAAKKARDLIRKGQNTRVSLPGKLVGSREKDPMKRELFLVEGQSAGGTAVEGRDAAFQEILFLRGKVLNVEKARLNRALNNQEIRNIITAIGTGILDEFDLSKCRYGKVILLTDADVDGAHIATLLFTFFYRYMKPLIEEGFLYIARPPLYKVAFKGKAAKLQGSQQIYLSSQRDLNSLIMGLENMDIDKKEITINRFKGLGEMNSDQLELTTMQTGSRKIEKVTIHDAIEAEDWLIRLMGDEVDARKEYIQQEVFQEVNVENKGDFYNVAFIEDLLDTEDIIELVDETEKELMKMEIEEEFDEYDPELVASLEKFRFG